MMITIKAYLIVFSILVSGVSAFYFAKIFIRRNRNSGLFGTNIERLLLGMLLVMYILSMTTLILSIIFIDGGGVIHDRIKL